MKGIILALVALSLFLVSDLSLARDVSIDLRKVQGDVNMGDECSVKVYIDQVRGLEGIDISISFDNQKLEYQSITKGLLLHMFVEDIVPDPEISNATGKIEYSAVLETPGTGVDSPGGTILTLTFVAKSPGYAWIRLNGWDCSVEHQGGRPIIDSKKRMIIVRPTKLAGNLKVNEPKKDTLVMESQVADNYLLDAGRDLNTSAALRYATLGLGLASLGLSLSSDESNSDFTSLLSLGGATLSLATPFFIGRAGKNLAKVSLGSRTQEAGIALQKYRKHYYGGLLTAIVGAGILTWGVSEESDPGIAVGTILALGGFLDATFVPPYYLGSAGLSLSRTDNLSIDADLHMQKAGLDLKEARGNLYGSIILSALGGVIAAYGMYNDEDSAIYTGGCALGLAAYLDLLASIRVHIAGTELIRSATMQ